MKLISLTQGQFAKVDDEDYDYLIQWKWCAAKQGRTYYAHRCIGKNRKKLLMHRVIMNAGATKLVVDHMDWDGLNNTKSNLRLITAAENIKHRNPQIKKERWEAFEAEIKRNYWEIINKEKAEAA